MSDHSSRLHAILSPSSSYRWMVCHGSKQGNLIESESTEAADAGTAKHQKCEGILTGAEEITEDTENVERWYVNTVQEQSEDATLVLHEVMLVSKELPDEHFGTCDTLIWNEDELTLTAIDAKFGRVPVYAEGNTQLMCYLNLAREDERFKKAKQFVGIIVSRHGVDAKTYTIRELNAIKKKVLEASKDDTRVAGGHCTHCPLLGECNVARTYNAQTLAIAEEQYGGFEPEVIEDRMTVEDAKKFIELAPVAAKLAAHARMALAKAMLAGTPVPGWKLGIAEKNRAWRDTGAALGYFQESGLTEEQIWKKTLLTPAKAEGIMGKPAKAVIAGMTKRDAKGIVAVPQKSSVREYVNGQDAVNLLNEVGDENE